MRIESMKLFAQLLEAYLPEDSSAMSTLGSVPGGREVVRVLHKYYRLAHDQLYAEEVKISWSILKDSRYGAWVLIKGEKGAGAIKAKTSGTSYMSVAFDPTTNAVETFEGDSGGNNIAWLKSKIGKLRNFYVGVDLGELERKKGARKRLASEPSANEVTVDTLITKFRPLWVRVMTAAEADIKGMVVNMIKNNAYDKAKKKMDRAENLMSIIERLEYGTLSDTPDFLKQAVALAVAMTASHHYPAQTGEITKRYGSYSPQFNEGYQMVLRDISRGDTAKLGTVLAFFKRSLISG